ncbi:MAG: CDP-glucose 4,6-dehydratase [Trueperaceae bacterium]|nr:CDP-glucose 4,6-dehydratase [Trueperaceae bacterium]
MIDAPFWSGRRVFVTGHTGFKGSWLASWLLELGADVHGYALRPPTEPNLHDALGLGGAFEAAIADVRDAERLRSELARARPEVVLHLAAQPLVRRSYADPLETFGSNVMGTANLLDAVRSVPDVRAVVVVTSDKVYENREWPWPYRESDALGGHDPYSSSKAATELVAASFRRSYFPPAELARHGVAVATARAGNVIGGGDWASDRLVPDLVRGFARGEPVVIRNPAAVRPWQHVLEPLAGYLVLAQRLYAGDAAACDGWNFGPREDDARPVGWLADRLAERWGPGASWVLDAGAHPHEAHLLRLDWSKARTQLGWRPRWDLATTLDRTAAWYRGYADDPAAAVALTRADRGTFVG